MEINVEEHGIAIDEAKKRVECKYCAKVVSGFHRLKCHLGGLRGDVLPCEQVPSHIKESFRAKLLQTRRKNLVKQVDHLFHPDLPLKRNWTYPNTNDEEQQVDQEEQNSKSRRGSKSNSNDLPKRKIAKVNETKDQAVKEHQKGNLNTSNSKLKEEVRQMKKYVKKVKDSCGKTGCSILLDEWIDETGRDLVNFLVDCPEGTIYVRSCDLSPFVGEIAALRELLEEVIEEIGVQNVVQIIASSTATRMWPAIRQIVSCHRNIYWALDASRYIGVILGRIGMMNPFREIFSNAKTLTQFIHGEDQNLLKLFKFHSHGHDLIKPHRIKSVMAYLTLGNIISQKQNLQEMVASSNWGNSLWASTIHGKMIVNQIINNLSFWKGAKVLLAATAPLIRAVCPINGKSFLTVGYIYQSLMQAKEETKVQMGNKASCYMPFWSIIDETWDIYLHRPLYSAGYYLNPCIFYTKNFYSDCEVELGLENCIKSMVEETENRALISTQLQEYEQARGGFKDGSSAEAIKDISPGA